MPRLADRSLLDGTFHLRLLRPDDAEAWFHIVTDPRVFGPTSWDIGSLDQMRVAVARRVEEGARWAIVRGTDGALVGTCGAGRWEEAAHTAEVAYELAPAVWGRGLATAAVRAFLDEAGAAGMRRVEAHSWVGNPASARVLERCGFAREAELAAFRTCRGEPRDFWRWSTDPARTAAGRGPE